MDGIASVQLRINDLRARFEPRPPAPSPATSPTSSTAAISAFSSTSSVGGSAGTTFADALAAATSDTASGSESTGPLRAAARLSPGHYGSLQPPAELVAYGNGQVPASALASLGVGEHRLHAPAAGAFRQMAADAKAQGVTIGVNESYRSLAEQQQLANQLGLYSQGGKAAAPGTSNHGWGLALDLQLDGRAQQWMRDNAYKYGFAEDVPREPWHWTYRPAS